MSDHGKNLTDYMLFASRTSTTDPSWAVYDYWQGESLTHWYFLVHHVSSGWFVVHTGDHGHPIVPGDYGAPADVAYP